MRPHDTNPGPKVVTPQQKSSCAIRESQTDRCVNTSVRSLPQRPSTPPRVRLLRGSTPVEVTVWAWLPEGDGSSPSRACWEGTMEGQPLRVSYRPISNGTAPIETLDAARRDADGEGVPPRLRKSPDDALLLERPAVAHALARPQRRPAGLHLPRRRQRGLSTARAHERRAMRFKTPRAERSRGASSVYRPRSPPDRPRSPGRGRPASARPADA